MDSAEAQTSSRHLMTRPAISISPKATIVEAAKLMREQHVGDVVVIQDAPSPGRPIGILTDRDIVVSLVAFRIPPENTLVEDLMTPQPVVAQADASLDRLLLMMREKCIKRLPLVD